MNRAITLLGLLVLLGGCPKKDDAVADGGNTISAASGSSTPTAASNTTTTTDTTTTTGEIETPPTSAPEVVADPNTPPSHDDHDKAANASIQKANYKSELDKLEKEDLNAK